MEILNRQVAAEFRKLLLRDIGLDIDVRFENKTDDYRKAGEHMEEGS